MSMLEQQCYPDPQNNNIKSATDMTLFFNERQLRENRASSVIDFKHPHWLDYTQILVTHSTLTVMLLFSNGHRQQVAIAAAVLVHVSGLSVSEL